MRQQHGGFFFITALVILVSMIALGLTSLTRSTTELSGSSRLVTVHRAFHLAESALDAALVNLQHGDFTDLVLTTMPGGGYWATVAPAGTLTFSVSAHGLREADQRDVDALVQLTPRSVFQFGLFGIDQLRVSGQAITDSYNSSLGAYNPDTPGQNGDVGTNSTIPGGVDISGSIAINGQVAVGPDLEDPASVVLTTGGSALITGSPQVVSQSEALLMPPIMVPAELSCTPLTVSGQTVIILSSAEGPRCFTTLTVSGGGTLTADGPVQVYVTGSFAASGNTLIGVPSNPSALTLFLVSSQEATLESSLTGSTQFYGGLYAPNATLEIDGNAEVFGSVTARVVHIAGNAQVHYDEALATLAAPSSSYTTKVLLWREE